MQIGLSLVISFLYWLATNKLWYGWLHLTRQPIVLAVPIGLIMGDLSQAMIIGAALQVIYLGAIAPGGTLPSDEALAACIAIPIALAADLSPEIAVSLAVPLGLLGTVIDNIKRTYHSYFIHQADVGAENLDKKKMDRNSLWLPLWASVPLRMVPVFLALILGVDAVEVFLNSLPEWALNGLTVAGGLLPALGFAVTILAIGKPTTLPFFILGFTIAAYSDMNMIGLSVIGVSIAIIISQFETADSSSGIGFDNKNEDNNEDLTYEEEGDF